jgi:hypothetical protein
MVWMEQGKEGVKESNEDTEVKEGMVDGTVNGRE